MVTERCKYELERQAGKQIIGDWKETPDIGLSDACFGCYCDGDIPCNMLGTWKRQEDGRFHYGSGTAYYAVALPDVIRCE